MKALSVLVVILGLAGGIALILLNSPASLIGGVLVGFALILAGELLPERNSSRRP
jgi:uncharacterized membrane protein (UPF0136 family)